MPNHPITILFDAHPLLGQKTGTGYYTSQLVSHMAAQYPNEVRLIGYYHNFLYRKTPITSPSADNIHYRTVGFFPGQIVNLLRRLHLSVPIELLTFVHADFILFPNYLGSPSLFKTPSAPVIHDLTFIDHPESMSDKNQRDLTKFVLNMIKRASFVITVSEFSKKRIVEIFAVGKDEILVTHIPPQLPVPLSEQEAAELLLKEGVKKPYILSLGTIEPRKNLLRLMEAYVSLPQSTRKRVALVIAGKVDWKYAETKQRLSALQAAGYDITYLGYVDDTLRAALYKRAALFVSSSYYEGFGMPILEALSYDTPCAVSDIPVFREVAADAVVYFDPYSVESMARVIERELGPRPSIDSQTRKKRLDRFSWDQVCQALYNRVAATVATKRSLRP